jgi:hypothetical protein
MELPKTGGRIFETADENLLYLAHYTGSAFLTTISVILLTHGGLVFMGAAPIVIVFTKNDQLVRSKRAELREEDGSLSEDVLRKQSKEEVQKTLDMCIRFLELAWHHVVPHKSQMPKPQHVNVSSINFTWCISSVLICRPP